MGGTVWIGLTAFAVIFGGAMFGFLLGKILPDKHRGAPTERVVQNAMRTLSLLSALVLGLLVATAKGKFDTNNGQVEHFAANLMFLNSLLVNYGAETDDIRLLLRKYTVAKIAATWRLRGGPEPEPGDPRELQLLESLRQKLLGLTPQSEYQRSMTRSASGLAEELVRARWLQIAQESDRVPPVFTWVLLTWLAILFVGFGLFSPRNAVTFGAMLICALSIAGAVALIADLDAPFDGLIFVSPEPMLKALDKMSEPSDRHPV